MRFSILLLYLFLTISSHVFAEGDTGTLVVSYQTGLKGERLDRVRFTLTNARNEQRMYPKKGGYVQDTTGCTRVVIIEDLEVGEYTLEFLVPNCDGLFEEVFPKKVTIAKGQTLKIDQSITICYVPLEASYRIADRESPLDVFPTISLKDKEGNIVLESKEGVLKSTSLPPGEYLIVYGALPGYCTPASIPVTLSSHDPPGLILGVYR